MLDTLHNYFQAEKSDGRKHKHMKKLDASVPRKNFWADQVPNKLRCPRCRTKLEKEHATYMVAMQIQGEFETFAMGNDFGSFCPHCPVVVLDRDGIGRQLLQMLEAKSPGERLEIAYTVVGIIDVDAIPEDKNDVPIGSDDNPIPLVEFVDTIERTDPSGEGHLGGKRLSGNQRRRLRKSQGA